jgi:hypothetical protein
MTEASCLLLVDMNLTIAPIVPALRLLEMCRASPYNPVVLVSPPRDSLGTIPSIVHARRVARLIPLMKPLMT